MSQVLISAAHKSSGKTTISIGLCAALTDQGHQVAPFKKGPDFIDPMWLGKAAQSECYNLDFYTMTESEIVTAFEVHGKNSDIRIIEGNKGLYDGLDLDGSNSNAALATLLKAPVILVIDAQGMTRGIAPLILGYQAFESNLTIAGVILNKLGGSRHESKLRNVIEHYTDVPVIGAVHRNKSLEIVERHLGLIPSNESTISNQRISSIAQLISEQVDLDKVLEIAKSCEPVTTGHCQTVDVRIKPDIRIGIARDAAFGFYYPDDITAFQSAGAELVNIDTLQDKQLPAIDGLFIGGGFPETHMQQLQANQGLRAQLKTAIDNGLPVYAECGGLMYLSRSIEWQGKRCEMVGAIPGDIVMHIRPQGRGYVKLLPTQHAPWPTAEGEEAAICVHEFHYSSLENVSEKLHYAYDVLRGTGIDGKHDGLLYKNILACYAHFRNVNNNQWVKRFVDYVRDIKTTQPSGRFGNCRLG